MSAHLIARDAVALMQRTIARAERERTLMIGRRDARGVACVDAPLAKMRATTGELALLYAEPTLLEQPTTTTPYPATPIGQIPAAQNDVWAPANPLSR